MKRSLLAILITVFALAATSLVLIQINQTRQSFSISDNMFNTAVGNAMDRVIDETAQYQFSIFRFQTLDSLIADALIESGIDLDPVVGIYDASNDEFYYCSSPGMENRLRTSPYKYSFHPSGVISHNQYYIALAFSSTALFLRQNSHLYLYMNIFLIVIIVLLFIISLVIIVNQRKVDEMKTTFVNNMTHEIKTPIATIGLACEMLEDPTVTPDHDSRRNYINIIADENRRMRTLVETILQSARMTDRRYPLNRQPTDINALVADVVQRFTVAVHSAGGTIEARLDASSATLSIDPLHIANMVYNLVDNAVKYSPSAPHVIVATQSDSHSVTVSVTDHGIGIARADQRRIFDRFYRVSTGDVHNVKGFGIGLDYVARVVRLHGGRIALHSAPGRGSTFTVTLPRPRPKTGKISRFFL